MSDKTKSLSAAIKAVVEPFGYKKVKGSTPRFELVWGDIARKIFLSRVSGDWLVQLMIELKPVPKKFPDEELLVLYYLNDDEVVYDDWGYHKLWPCSDIDEMCASIKEVGLPFLEEIGTPASVYSFLKRLAFEGHPEAPERSDDLEGMGKVLESEIAWGKPSQKGVPQALLHLSLLCERLGDYEEALQYAESYEEWLRRFESPMWQSEKEQVRRLLQRLNSQMPSN